MTDTKDKRVRALADKIKSLLVDMSDDQVVESEMTPTLKALMGSHDYEVEFYTLIDDAEFCITISLTDEQIELDEVLDEDQAS